MYICLISIRDMLSLVKKPSYKQTLRFEEGCMVVAIFKHFF